MGSQSTTNFRDELKLFISKTGLSSARVAKAMGYSQSTLSQYFSESYKGDIEKLELAIESYLLRENEKAGNRFKQITFAETTIARTIFRTARTCHLNSVMGMVYGSSGLGKTTGAVQYASQYKDCIYILANKSYTPKVLFKKLHLICGFDGKGYINEMFDDVVERLKDSGRLLIIDQAEYLNNTALHLIRTLFDESKVGILLMGLDELFYNVRGQRGEFAQLYTRITVPVKLREWKLDDVNKIVTQVFGDAELAKDFYRHSNGNGMMLRNLIFNTMQYGEANGQVSPEIIAEAAKLLIN